MKTYRGRRENGSTQVTVSIQQGNGDPVTAPLVHHSRHSPDAYEWGYAGSGPRELARCLLIDALELGNLTHTADVNCCSRENALDEIISPAMSNAFKEDSIASIEGDKWTIYGESVVAWIMQYPGADGAAARALLSDKGTSARY